MYPESKVKQKNNRMWFALIRMAFWCFFGMLSIYRNLPYLAFVSGIFFCSIRPELNAEDISDLEDVVWELYRKSNK